MLEPASRGRARPLGRIAVVTCRECGATQVCSLCAGSRSTPLGTFLTKRVMQAASSPGATGVSRCGILSTRG
eukprot:1133832-Rhodomonas_salina.1